MFLKTLIGAAALFAAPAAFAQDVPAGTPSQPAPETTSPTPESDTRDAPETTRTPAPDPTPSPTPTPEADKRNSETKKPDPQG